jgi:enoyl-CoA hydratase/carnithine racemase
MTAQLRIETAGGIATLTLDRPSRRNALSRELLKSLKAALTTIVADELRAVILTGAGDCFSAGADLLELQGTPEDVGFDDALTEIAAAVRDGPFLAIAAIEGPCVGAAFDLACACDARVASPKAFFELPAVRLGLLYNPAAIARIQHMLSVGTVQRLLLLGERIDGSQALAAGIVTHLAEEAQTIVTAGEIARRAIASPRALIETKFFLRALEQRPVDLAPWQAIRRELLASPERQAAVAAAKSRLHM